MSYTLADLAAFNIDSKVVSGGGGMAERVNASVVTPNFFRVTVALATSRDPESLLPLVRRSATR